MTVIITPTSWNWSFGDNTPNATVQNPVHIYTNPGLYTVNLTVTNSYGSGSIKKSNYINVTSPPGFLDGWSYRKLHTIAGSSAGQLTNYQVKFTVWNTTGTDNGENVYLGNKVKPDYSDLRITGTDNTPISYCIIDSNSTAATVWAKIPLIPTGGTQVYLYYGNNGAVRASDGTSTFLFYDSFDGSSIDTTKWAVGGTGTRTVSNSIVKQLISGSGAKETLTGITDNTGNNIVTGFKHRVDQDSGSNSAERIGIQNDYKVVFSNNGGNIKQFLNENTAWGPTFGTFNVGQWYITEMYYDGKQLQTRDDYSPTWNAWTVSGKSGHMDIWAFAYSGGTVRWIQIMCINVSM